MKTAIIAVLALVLTASCRKNNMEGRQLLEGKWELRQSSGGIAGTINYLPGNGTIFSFDSNNAYQLLNSGGIVQAGSYEIKKYDNSGDWLLQRKYIFNSHVITEKDSIRLNTSKLIFLPSAPCCDMPTVSYERLHK